MHYFGGEHVHDFSAFKIQVLCACAHGFGQRSIDLIMECCFDFFRCQKVKNQII